MKDALSNVEGFRKTLQDSLAPELRTLAVHLESNEKRLDDLKDDVAGGREELRALRDEKRADLNAAETRMKEAIEQAKREMLISFQLRMRSGAMPRWPRMWQD